MRLDYVPGSVGAPRIKKLEKEVRKGMSSRIPWVAATLVIVVAAGLGAWMLSTPLAKGAPFGSVETWNGTTSGAAGWTSLTSSSGSLRQVSAVPGTAQVNVPIGWGLIGGRGIENLNILDNEAMGGTHGLRQDARADNYNKGQVYVMGSVTATGGSTNIPYENTFAFAASIVVSAPENMAYVVRENVNVDVKLVFPGATVEENSVNDNIQGRGEYIRGQTGGGTTSGIMYINAVWDNYGACYKLSAGYSLDIQRVTVWTWK
jgi:hypothetical protein